MVPTSHAGPQRGRALRRRFAWAIALFISGAAAYAVYAGVVQPQLSLCGPKPGLPPSNACFTNWCCDGEAWVECQFKAAGTSCDDGNACTYSDKCNGVGDCVGTAITCTSDPGPCGAVRSCNGTSSCSVSYAGSTTSCNDNNPCTYGDHCNGAGSCVGTVITCTSDACTTRSCNGTSSCSVSYPGPATSCDDGVLCTYGDHCNGAGSCVGTTIDCTSDPGPCGAHRDCNGTSSCSVSYPGSTTSCNDNNACTYGDHCNGAGSCVGTTIDCRSDPGPCGAHRDCNGTSSCSVSYAGPATSCDDGNICTYGDHCDGNGSCVGTAITCASDTCAQRTCNGTSSCTVVLTFAPCDDGNACTYGDTCDATGQCAGTPVYCLPAGPCQRSDCNGTAACTVTTVGRGIACSEGPTCGGFCDGISLHCQPAE